MKHLLLSLFAVATAHAQSASVTLAWDANPELDISGYRVYHGQQSGALDKIVAVGNTTTATVPDLVAGTHFFALTAFNLAGLESERSDVLSADIPAGTPAQGPGVTITLRVPDLVTGEPYLFDMRALNALGQAVPLSIAYVWDSVDQQVAPPGEPRKAATVPTGSYSWTATVDWPPSPTAATEAITYRVDYGTTSGKPTKTLSVSGPSVSVPALGRLATYYLRVVAIGTSGRISEQSAELKLTFAP